MYSKRIRQPQIEFDPVVTAFVAASRERHGGQSGWEARLEQRLWCDVCSESYRLENLQVCTDCPRHFCYRCAASHQGCSGQLVG